MATPEGEQAKRFKNFHVDPDENSHFYEDHAELMHYTTAAGLQGIVSSGMLRCTHFKYLNDDREVSAGHELLLSSVKEKLPDIGLRLKEVSEKFARVLAVTAEEEGISEQDLILYEGETVCDAIRTTYEFLSPPYICSFCEADNNKVAQDGLLSMWRGYGKDGGYCLVLGTEGIHDLMDEELENYSHSVVQIGNVAYTGFEDVAKKIWRGSARR